MKSFFSGGHLRSVFWCLATTLSLHGQTKPTNPTFNLGQDPSPDSKSWKLIDDLSDEFDSPKLDLTKWENTRADLWVGRPPGLFQEKSATVAAEHLRLENYLLDSPRVIDGETYTHGCGNIWSKRKASVGYYIEAKMKANKTFMSSTFWLINRPDDFTGCDRRTTELDIVEVVGLVTSTDPNKKDYNKNMNSNSHSRNTSCPETPTGSRGTESPINEEAWANYHVYGCWWKSPKELIFFLDGQEVHSITPKADFNLDMYLRLVTETYKWNSVPNDGQQGMGGTQEERTTYYDWVRTWELTPKNLVTNDIVTIDDVPDDVIKGQSFDVEVHYEATSSADIVVALYDPSGSTFFRNAKKKVDAGIGTVTITIQTEDTWPIANDYEVRAIIREVDGNFMTDRDIKKTTIDLTEDSLSISEFRNETEKRFSIFPNPVKDEIFNLMVNENIKGAKLYIYDLKGDLVLQKKVENTSNKITIGKLTSGIYLIKINKNQHTLVTKLVVQ